MKLYTAQNQFFPVHTAGFVRRVSPLDEIQAILFDMDNTLYTNNEYAKEQIDLPVTRLAEILGKSYTQMIAEISQIRKNYSDVHMGQAISLCGIFLSFGVSVEESVKIREEVLQPEKHLNEDKKLTFVLKELALRFPLAVVTNNPVLVAVRTLSILGVKDFFRAIVGLDTCMVSKPHPAPLLKAALLCETNVKKCISVGDRYFIDISPALELGMSGVLVDGVEDVYKLPELFLK
ncbi:MAG: HAD family hydrolase [Treponema sp.]|jgi:phosphoglycolate phosphatase/putative hydrolase of the HAD superfamily|nr:HAD family hydrolase [Treponema sp.]